MKSPDNLKVLSGDNMTIGISTGSAFINGVRYAINESPKMLTIANASGINPRIDRVVIRLDYSLRKAQSMILSGEPDTIPKPPEIVRDGDIYDISLATINVGKGATKIADKDITDTRLMADVCGVAGIVSVDTFLFESKADKSEVKYFAYDFGDIKLTACTNPPKYWLLCNGQVISREEYSDLFKAIGETYGKGDGLTTFNLPDLTGRTAIGVNSAHSLGSKGGSETHTLSVSEMPAHSHITAITNGKATSGTDYDYISSNAENIGGPINKRRGYMLSEISGIANVTGSSQAHNNMQPFLSLNYIIFTGV